MITNRSSMTANRIEIDELINPLGISKIDHDIFDDDYLDDNTKFG